jgi:hypothetical protein
MGRIHHPASKRTHYMLKGRVGSQENRMCWWRALGDWNKYSAVYGQSEPAGVGIEQEGTRVALAGDAALNLKGCVAQNLVGGMVVAEEEIEREVGREVRIAAAVAVAVAQQRRKVPGRAVVGSNLGM